MFPERDSLGVHLTDLVGVHVTDLTELSSTYSMGVIVTFIRK